MANNLAHGTMSLVLVLAAFLSITLSIFWLLNGIGSKNPSLVVRGVIVFIFGLGLGAVENFVK